MEAPSISVTFRSPSSIAPPLGAYSHVADVPSGTRLLFLAGQVGNHPDGSIPESVEEQYTQALRNIAEILRSEGLSGGNIVKINTYLVKPPSPERMRGVRQSILGEISPASTLIYVPRLATEALLVEIEVVAAASGSSSE